jgi:UDP-N-acetylmuramyl pentapeptide phosphotransferase/UDP-N-acetylglucosamine-1-phosphate transferase
VVWGRRIFVTCGDTETGRRTVLCLDAGDGHALFPVVVPLLILAVPIYDTVSVVLIRIASGKPIFKGDTITFLYVDHHNFVYQKASEIMQRWEREIED